MGIYILCQPSELKKKNPFPTPQVLGSIKNRIEAFAASHEDFPAMLRKAQQYLVARGKVDWADTPSGVPPLRRSDSLGEDATTVLRRRETFYWFCFDTKIFDSSCRR